MKCIIRRRKSGSDGTPGRLVSEKGFACDTLELPWKDNQRGISCIKAGSYLGWLWQSPSMGRMVVRLEDKNGRKDCLIHNGNFAGDQTIDLDQDGTPDNLTQVHGCTEVGQGYGVLGRPDGRGKQFGILSSKDTLAKLVAHLGPGSHEFIYAWDQGCEP